MMTHSFARITRPLGWLLAPLCAAALLLSTTAGAQDWEPDTHRSGAGAEIYLWSARNQGTSLPVVGFGNFGVGHSIFIDGYLPIATEIDGPGGVSRGGMGNPTAAVRFAPKMGIVRWWIGGGIGAPLGSVHDADWKVANLHAALAMGAYDVHLWLDDTLPMHFTGGVDIRPADFVSIQAEAKPIFIIPIGNRDDFDLVLQNRFGVEFRHPPSGVGGGAHFKTVWVPTSSCVFWSCDNAQLAFDPFFAYTGRVFFLRLGLLMPLDDPLGFAFDRGKVLSPHLTLGGQW